MTSQYRAGDHQCAVYRADEKNANRRGFQNCTTNPGHKNFMTIAEFRERGPPFLLSERAVKDIWNNIDRTARVVVSYTSLHRPDTYPKTDIPYPLKQHRGEHNRVRYGTGSLFNILDHLSFTSCPCYQCSKSKSFKSQASNTKPEFSAYFQYLTATHVVFDDDEAQNSIFELFYDSEDREGVKCLYGVGVRLTERDRLTTDRCCVICVTHDSSLAERLKVISRAVCCDLSHDKGNLGGHVGSFVSHPHGVSKRISFGQFTKIKCSVVNQHESQTVLKKGLTVRISGKQDCTSVVRNLDLKSPNCAPKCDQDDRHSTFEMVQDITITHPLNLTVECDVVDESDLKTGFLEAESFTNQWWALPPGIKAVTESGTLVSLPNNPDILKLEVYIKGSLFESQFLCTNDENPCPAFRFKRFIYYYLGYNMDACAGSSGGRILTDDRMPDYLEFHATHFGCMGDTNWSGLLEPFNHLSYGSENANNEKKTISTRTRSKWSKLCGCFSAEE